MNPGCKIKRTGPTDRYITLFVYKDIDDDDFLYIKDSKYTRGIWKSAPFRTIKEIHDHLEELVTKYLPGKIINITDLDAKVYIENSKLIYHILFFDLWSVPDRLDIIKTL